MAGDFPPISRISADRPPLVDDEGLRRTLGEYLVAAVPQFYKLVPVDSAVLHGVLGASIGAPGSEFENSFMAGTAERPAGIVASVPIDRLKRAQQASTISLMRHIEREDLAAFRSAVAEYSSSVESIEGSGRYLSRVAVAREARGTGLGERLVAQIIAEAAGGNVWLHVAKDNGNAIRLYERLGFEFVSDAQFASRAMRRPGRRVGQ